MKNDALPCYCSFLPHQQEREREGEIEREINYYFARY